SWRRASTCGCYRMLLSPSFETIRPNLWRACRNSTRRSSCVAVSARSTNRRPLAGVESTRLLPIQ
ncbi:hypothetical protein H4S03_009412, partial [Coemansia sp. S3946]